MTFALDPAQQLLVEEVDATLAAAPSGLTGRELLARLGTKRLLAAHWPEEFGGRGLRLVDHAAVSERIGLHGLPDVPHLVSVQGVGSTILVAGTDAQRQAWLPPIATGGAFASLLLSEEGAGSELSAIKTVAAPTDAGYRLVGEKAWNLRADWSACGLCAARTRESARDPYDGVSLLLVPFDAPGVTVIPRPRAAGEPYFSVRLEGVEVPRDAVVGREHRAWSTIVRAIGFERVGWDYLARGQRWLRSTRALVGLLSPARREAARTPLLRLERRLAQARALAYRSVAAAEGVDPNEEAAAYAKIACSDAAQAVAWWAAENLGDMLEAPVDQEGDDLSVVRGAIAEAPELSVSGGATEMHLDTIALDLRSSATTA